MFRFLQYHRRFSNFSIYLSKIRLAFFGFRTVRYKSRLPAHPRWWWVPVVGRPVMRKKRVALYCTTVVLYILARAELSFITENEEQSGALVKTKDMERKTKKKQKKHYYR
jgi:hypothetical protein